VAETLRRLPQGVRAGVVEGDVRGTLDAERLKGLGAPVWAITTGDQCHLDARQVGASLTDATLAELDLLIVENVGNLVCPASFPIGEHARVVLLSVTEGDDKPDKYPLMFERADLLVVTKSDLIPHCDFVTERATAAARRLRRDLPVIELSCRTGEGVEAWMAWLGGLLQR
jgi:hydrogenase nickel incorporation protein HypB